MTRPATAFDADDAPLQSRLETLRCGLRAVYTEMRVERARPLPDGAALGRLRAAEARLAGQIARLTVPRTAT